MALSRAASLRRALFLSFQEHGAVDLTPLRRLSEREWRGVLQSLDHHALGMYFLHRCEALGTTSLIPPKILARLRQNLKDNTERSNGMLDESVAIQTAFQEAGLSYSVLKGISLWPTSVPLPELRHQADLDFLMAEASAPQARALLERRGYRLYAISGRSWEFKLNETPHFSAADRYKDVAYRTVELHLELPGRPSLLSRTIMRRLHGIDMPVLSDADLFLGQGMHVFKDVCGASRRASHLLEFYRHIIARYHDEAFWAELEALTQDDMRSTTGIGVVVYLLTVIMGSFAPPALTRWSADMLPPRIQLWLDVYGDRLVFSTLRGSKLYLLLVEELEAAGLQPRRPIATSLLPNKLPPLLIRAQTGESLHTRIARYRLQLWYIGYRARFHAVEGLRYAWESRRWRRRLRAIGVKR